MWVVRIQEIRGLSGMSTDVYLWITDQDDERVASKEFWGPKDAQEDMLGSPAGCKEQMWFLGEDYGGSGREEWETVWGRMYEVMGTGIHPLDAYMLGEILKQVWDEDGEAPALREWLRQHSGRKICLLYD